MKHLGKRNHDRAPIFGLYWMAEGGCIQILYHSLKPGSPFAHNRPFGNKVLKSGTTNQVEWLLNPSRKLTYCYK